MEPKDWAILCIPILCNGVIFFVFQQKYIIAIKEAEKKNTYKKDVLIFLLSLLQDFYLKIRDLSKIDSSRSGKEYEFADLWNPAVESIEKVFVALNTYPKTIGELSFFSKINSLIKEWDNLNESLYDERRKGNEKISSEVANIMSVSYQNIINKVKEIMYSCEEEIINT